MKIDTYHSLINTQKELEIRDEVLFDVLKFYVLFTGIKELSFLEYNYELNNFNYSFSINSQKHFIEDYSNKDIFDKNYSLIIEEENTIYGMITFDNDPESSEITQELFEKIKATLKKIFLLKKSSMSQESILDIYIITDSKSLDFSNKLQNNLEVLLNANIRIETTVAACIDELKEKTKKSILIYAVEDSLLLKTEENLLVDLNEFLIVIGPSDYNLSLFCGQLNVYQYLSKNNFTPEQLKNIIIELKQKIQNKYINKNKIIAVSGISGGVGTTTIAMNTADLIAQKNPDKNILYIDIATTKSISNLFLEQDPMPKKTIIDLVNSNEFDMEKNLKNGLVMVRENFYATTGIQKHIDIDFLAQDVFLEKLLEYISKMSETFNFIIIDTGESDATLLNTTIYDIVNELWIITEMSLPHISKLKTFFSLMKRAGLKDKISFLVNRYDSVNAISVSDVISILNTSNEDELNFDIKIPNDYETLGYCWNYCELATNTHPKSIFVQKLEQILINKKFIKADNTKKDKESKNIFSFITKMVK